MAGRDSRVVRCCKRVMNVVDLAVDQYLVGYLPNRTFWWHMWLVRWKLGVLWLSQENSDFEEVSRDDHRQTKPVRVLIPFT